MADFTMYLRLPLACPDQADIGRTKAPGFRDQARRRLRLAQMIAAGDADLRETAGANAIVALLSDASELFDAADRRDEGKTIVAHCVVDEVVSLRDAAAAIGSALGAVETLDEIDCDAVSDLQLGLMEGLFAMNQRVAREPAA